MRKATLKRDLSYHEGALSAIRETLAHIDNLIIETSHYRENDKLWRLRDTVLTMLDLALKATNELREELNQ